MPFRPALPLAVAVVALMAASQAAAHAKLVSSSPAANATVAAPAQIELRFNEKLQPKFSGFELRSGGVAVPVKVSVGQDGLTMVGTPARALGAGAYEVNWHAITADTHRMQGVYAFTVR